MLFVNLSRDVIVLQSLDHQSEIKFGDLEKIYPQILTEMVGDLDDNSILVVNGPGGFASLRCGCLGINLLQMLGSEELQIYDLSKIDIYKYAYGRGFLPRYGLIYLGQKKNLRKYDFETNSFETINQSNIGSIMGEYFLDDVESHQLFDSLPGYKKVAISHTDGGVGLDYQGQTLIIALQDLDISTSHYLMPNYMMEPTIG